MTKKMLIDASHAEETRVVILDGNRLEDFDVETAARKQIKGNIYLAKVIRVEPSLQAAFVEYGGNRHGFLAFSEIHPDYYQIPIADREKLLALQAEEEAARAAEEAGSEAEEEAEEKEETAQALAVKPIEIIAAPPPEEPAPHGEVLEEPTGIAEALREPVAAEEIAPDPEAPAVVETLPEETTPVSEPTAETTPDEAAQTEAEYLEAAGAVVETVETPETVETIEPETEVELLAPEQIGGDGDDAAEARERRLRQRFLRNYKIQDVIHRRQIMLVQVVKEERGNKGAALTTYLSLAGRFSVLMPNSPTGGGISRKITSQADRRRLKEAIAELDIPRGMGLIVRTAGANRPKAEIKRDCEYLLRLWDDIRDKTLQSIAPALIYEEANLIKRAIRDVYTRDIDEILVEGEEGYRAARDFMRMLMPGHARKVQLWTNGQPLFSKYQVEAQLDAMLNPVVQLRSGGYLVINQTEALVAIDVNSGRSTRERNVEDMALRTNLEAAEEVARQLRLRDLAGLIVIDFIDMESRKNNAAVERRLKEALRHDRARIQVGSISHFGLLEMSRQRLRPSLAEASLIPCPHCGGIGFVRSPESAALHVLRAIEEEGAKYRAAEIAVALAPETAFYLFNQKRDRLADIEERYAMRVIFNPDATLTNAHFRIERLRPQTMQPPLPAPIRPERRLPAPVEEISEEEELEVEVEEAAETGEAEESKAAENGERKRRRRRRGKRREERGGPEEAGRPEGEHAVSVMPPQAVPDDQPTELDLVLEAALGAPVAAEAEPALAAEAPAAAEEPAPKRRRPRVGRRRRPAEEEAQEEAATPAPVYADIADIFEAAEQAEAEARRAAREAAEAVQPLLAEEPPTEAEDAARAWAEDAQRTAEPVAATPELAAPESEPSPESAVKPILVGSETTPAAKKSGWWRR